MFTGKKKPGKTGQEHTWTVWRHSYTFVAYKQCAPAHVHSSVSIIMVRKDFEKTKGTKKPVSSETGLYGSTITAANARPPVMNARIIRKSNHGTTASAMTLIQPAPSIVAPTTCAKHQRQRWCQNPSSQGGDTPMHEGSSTLGVYAQEVPPRATLPYRAGCHLRWTHRIPLRRDQTLRNAIHALCHRRPCPEKAVSAQAFQQNACRPPSRTCEPAQQLQRRQPRQTHPLQVFQSVPCCNARGRSEVGISLRSTRRKRSAPLRYPPKAPALAIC